VAGSLVAIATTVVCDLGATYAYQAATNTLPQKEADYRIKSDTYHHTLKPMVVQDGAWGPYRYAYRTNSLGFRDRRPRHIPLQTAARRILFIGDSFTEGVGVDYDASFVGLLDKRLGAMNVAVLNAAVSSYSPIIYWAKVRYLVETVGLRFSDLVVYIDPSDIEDETEYYLDADGHVQSHRDDELQHDKEIQTHRAAEAAAAYRRFLGVRPFLRDHTTLVHLAGLGARNVLSNVTVNAGPATDPVADMLNARRALWTVDQTLWDEFGRRGLELAASHMESLNALCLRHGIALRIAVYPWPDHIARHDLDSRQVGYWRAWCERHHVPFINHFPDFVNDAPGWRRTLLENFIPGDVHWNQNGHRKIADRFMASYLYERSVFSGKRE